MVLRNRFSILLQDLYRLELLRQAQKKDGNSGH